MEQSAKVIQDPYSVHDQAVTVTVKVGEEGVQEGAERGTGREDGGIWSNQPRCTRTLFCPRSGGDGDSEGTGRGSTGGGREGYRKGGWGIWSNQPRYTRTLFYPRARLSRCRWGKRWVQEGGREIGVYGAISQGIQEPYSVHDQAVTVQEGGIPGAVAQTESERGDAVSDGQPAPLPQRPAAPRRPLRVSGRQHARHRPRYALAQSHV